MWKVNVDKNRMEHSSDSWHCMAIKENLYHCVLFPRLPPFESHEIYGSLHIFRKISEKQNPKLFFLMRHQYLTLFRLTSALNLYQWPKITFTVPPIVAVKSPTRQHARTPPCPMFYGHHERNSKRRCFLVINTSLGF